MNPTTQKLNELVEEFDRATDFQFDAETSLPELLLIGATWPHLRKTWPVDFSKVLTALGPAKFRC